MSRSWLGRPAGRHAAGPRGRAARPSPAQDGTPPGGASQGARQEAAPARQSPPAAPPGGMHLLGAPVLADAPPAPLSSPVTDEARAAAGGSPPPASVPPGVYPLVTIDALGRECPVPIIMLASQIGDIPVGSVIAVLADDPAAYTDIPAWCGLKSHDCVFRAEHAGGWSFGIRRRY